MSRDTQSFSRDIYPILKRNGVQLKSTTESIDDNTPNGKLMRNISISMAQYDNDQKAKVASDNMKIVAQQGWWQTTPPLGFKPAKIATDEINHISRERKTHPSLEPDLI